ncbi:MAG: hypothetical protein WA955_15735 [Diaphorobacter nitroreducens]|uniref:hypothetical protein n=1 Tax=Diaphorobacter nitroreducens TaxID=164759 RepID=UPI003C71DC2D
MADQIRPLTPDALRSCARAAAKQGIPLEEAHAHLAHEPALREQFEAAYTAALQAEVA